MKDNEWYELVGKHIKEIVKTKFPTQKEAAKLLDISEAMISRIITGDRKPNRVTLLKLFKLGLDKKHLELYDSLDGFKPEELSKQELIDLMRERRIFAKQQEVMIDQLITRWEYSFNRIEELRREVLSLTKKLHDKELESSRFVNSKE